MTIRATLAALVAGALLTSPAAVAGAAPVVLVEWRDQQVATTAVSSPATEAQSAGVVLIETVLPYEGATAAGTGIVLTASGQVLTNYHVVEGANTITVTVANTGRTYAAAVVGSDETDDVALLQLKGATGLTTVDVDDDTTANAQRVTAVGNAEGAGSLTAAAGTIVSLHASVTTAAEGSVASETLTTMIETTADVVPGDSGGPLLDAEGEVVGIDTAASTGAVINGYAIPIDRALEIVQQIRSGTETSSVQIGSAAFLGVELAPVDARRSYGADGAPIGGVVSGTAADRAGLAAGDTITRLGGHAVTSADDVATLLADHDPGDRVSIAWTDASGTEHTATVTLGASLVA